MGVAKGIVMTCDLNALLVPVDGLEPLVAPFDKKEINDTIKCMPYDKSPGPDGFNGKFLKTCWSLICSDFYSLAEEFLSGHADMEGLNSSFITLIPKKANPETVNDFRPISLTSVGIKFL